MKTQIEQIQKLDTELVEIIKDFLLLTPLSWSKDVMQDFLMNESKGNLTLPEITYPKLDFNNKIFALTVYLEKLGKDSNPAVSFLRDTAESYLDAYRILQGSGTKDVSEFSRKLYGSPKDLLPGYKRRNVDIAHYFLRVVEDYKFNVAEEKMIYNASQFRESLLERVADVIDPNADPISITVDSDITARAAAGSNYVKIRDGAMFSKSDLDQLLHHEVMIHTLTYINGRKQPMLKTLGYNAPRTTATQEGLAVFAEYINNSIDLVRLKRIALRILAIDMAEKGADFIDLFKFFRKHDQNEEESYYSAMRIFRGGTAKGGIVFYKDNVYLKGLIEVSSFLKEAVHQGKIHDIDLLFCGKLTTGDIASLKPLFEADHIINPTYRPEWASRSSELAAHLAFNDLTERFNPKEQPKER